MADDGRQVIAPRPSPARAPSTPMVAPTIGPPIGVEPWKATNHSDITRPRIAGSAVSCSVELPVAMNEMLAPPASASAISSSGRVGASGGERHRDAERRRREHERTQPGLALGGHEQPADDRADAHRRGHEAEAGGAGVQAPAAPSPAASPGTRRSGSPTSAHHQQRHRELRRAADVAQALAQLARARGVGAVGSSAVRSMRQQRGDHGDEAGGVERGSTTPSPTVAISRPATAGPTCARR